VRALKAAQIVGVRVTGYEIDPSGRIVIRTGDEPANDDGPNPCDRVLKR
jgi:hypothetical protein